MSYHIQYCPLWGLSGVPLPYPGIIDLTLHILYYFSYFMLSCNLKKQKESNVRTPWNQNILVTLMYTSKTDGLDFPIKVVKQNDTQMDLLQKKMHALWLAFLFMRFAALPRRDS